MVAPTNKNVAIQTKYARRQISTVLSALFARAIASVIQMQDPKRKTREGIPYLMAVTSQKLSTLADAIHRGRCQSVRPMPSKGWLSTESLPKSQIARRHHPVCGSNVKCEMKNLTAPWFDPSWTAKNPRMAMLHNIVHLLL